MSEAKQVAALSSPAQLLRSFAYDFLTCHDLSVVVRIMHPDYRLTIGSHRLAGRDAVYLPATAAQLEQFPGLCFTVHDVMLTPEAVALRFTEHGVSRKHDKAAAWGGISIFKTDAGRLVEGWANEDYFARRRQLADGVCDGVSSPHPAPWDRPVESPNFTVEHIARDWLRGTSAFDGTSPIEQSRPQGPSLSELIQVDEFVVDTLFSAGNRVAFHGVCWGGYAGGFSDVDRVHDGKKVELSVTGILSVTGGAVENCDIVYDRFGLYRSLSSRN